MQVSGDLKTRKRTGSSCQIGIIFPSKNSVKISYLVLKFLVELQFSLLNMITEHQQVS